MKTRQELDAMAQRMNVPVEQLAQELGITLQPTPLAERRNYTDQGVTIQADTVDYGIKPEPLGHVEIPAIVQHQNQNAAQSSESILPSRAAVELPPIEAPKVQFPPSDSDIQDAFMYAVTTLGLSSISPETMLIVQHMRDHAVQSETINTFTSELFEKVTVLEAQGDRSIDATSDLIKVTEVLMELLKGSLVKIDEHINTNERLLVAIIRLIVESQSEKKLEAMSTTIRSEGGRHETYIQEIINEAKICSERLQEGSQETKDSEVAGQE